MPFVQGLNEEEVHRQYVHLRLLLNLMVYATACPEAVYKGWPVEFGTAPAFHKCDPTVLGSPIPKGLDRGGTHASPIPHWRNPYFRQYPRRPDGTRKKGIVFVHGGMVNATLDPTTVKEKEGAL